MTLSNTSGASMRVTGVIGVTDDTKWSEFGAYLVRDASDFVTGQPDPGYGEVGVVFKDPGEFYPSLRWDGLTVPHGTSLILCGPWESNTIYLLCVDNTASEGVMALRQPQYDNWCTWCSGEPQQTEWDPWENESNEDWHVSGALIYAPEPGIQSDRIDTACLYVLDETGTVEYQFCDGLNLTGNTDLSDLNISVIPGHSIAVQATHTCEKPRNWGYAAWVLINKE